MDRAYSLLTVKAVSEDQRIVEGVASTPVLDRGQDRVNPLGAQFKLPLPFLWQHNAADAIGNVEYAKPTKEGIPFRARLPFIQEPGSLKDFIDRAWQELKTGLMRGASIGFNIPPGGASPNKEGGLDINKWNWLELSAVRIPMNAEASILSVKSICAEQQAVSGQRSASIQIILPPGVTGSPKQLPTRRENTMPNVSEHIEKLEGMRGPKATRYDEVMQKALNAGRTLDEAEQKECSELKAEIEAIDTNLDLLRFQEKGIAATVQPVATGSVAAFKSAIPSSPIRYPAQAKAAKPEPGIRIARIMRVQALARQKNADVLRIAENEYGTRDPVVVQYFKANEVNPLMTDALGDGLIPDEVGLGDFAEYLRPLTITGQFGNNGIPQFRVVPFRSGLAGVTVGATANWVGEANPKPLTFIDTARNHLLPLKVAGIIAISMETLRDSSPAAEGLIRDELTNAVIETVDTTFIDPSVSAVSNVSPASITYDQDSIASTGPDIDDVILDLRALFAKFDAGNNRASQAVLVMSTGNARALAFMQNALGSMAFPTMQVRGGTLNGVPVITSDYVGDNVVLISAGDVLMARINGVDIKMSTEASLEMKEYGHLTQHGSPTATGASMVSLWQNNMAAFLAEQTMNWTKRRDVVAPYLTGVAWGGAVPAS